MGRSYILPFTWLFLSVCAVLVIYQFPHLPVGIKGDMYFRNWNRGKNASQPCPTAEVKKSVVETLAELAPNLPKDERTLFTKKMKVNYGSIWMGRMEVNLVLRYLNGVETYLEWGSGGSTYNFAQFAKTAVSIEHNEEWCHKVKGNLAGKTHLSHVDLHCVPVKRGYRGWGRTGQFEEGSYHAFHDYIDEIDKCGHTRYNLILVDGRARVAAGVKALAYLGSESVLVIHDARRLAYRYLALYRWYGVVDSCGGEKRQGLAILKRKKEFAYLEGNHTAVQKILQEITYNTSNTGSTAAG